MAGLMTGSNYPFNACAFFFLVQLAGIDLYIVMSIFKAVVMHGILFSRATLLINRSYSFVLAGVYTCPYCVNRGAGFCHTFPVNCEVVSILHSYLFICCQLSNEPQELQYLYLYCYQTLNRSLLNSCNRRSNVLG